jgi:hypothetical protein
MGRRSNSVDDDSDVVARWTGSQPTVVFAVDRTPNVRTSVANRHTSGATAGNQGAGCHADSAAAYSHVTLRPS